MEESPKFDHGRKDLEEFIRQMDVIFKEFLRKWRFFVINKLNLLLISPLGSQKFGGK